MAQSTALVKSPYIVSAPATWTVEHFSLPPEFSPLLPWKGQEEIRLHPNWTQPEKDGYWSYVYLWWINGNAPVDAGILKENLQIYYDGLLNHLIPKDFPVDKITRSVAIVQKIKTDHGDKQTFAGQVAMLNFMSQRPIVLFVVIHVKEIGSAQNTAVRVEASPKTAEHSVWKELKAIRIEFKD